MSDDEENSLVVNDYLYGVTLDCMMNKSQKNKYMAKTNPEQHNKEKKKNKLMEKYKIRILELTRKKLENFELEITNDVDESFDDYIKTLFRYFKMKDIEENGIDKDEDDILFNDMDSSEDESLKKSKDITSIWGNVITKKMR